MRLLLIGMRTATPDEGVGGTHGANAREMGLAWGFAGRGHHVAMVSPSGGGPTRDGSIYRIRIDDAVPAEYDAVLLMDVPAIRDTLERHPLLYERVLAHPCIAYQVDQPYTYLVDWAHVYAMLTPDAAYKASMALPAGKDIFVMPWANSNCPGGLPNPYPPSVGPRVIYAGGCDGFRPDHRRDVINALAQRSDGTYEVWFCGGVGYKDHLGPTNEERCRDFDPRVRFVTDIAQEATTPQGLMPYGKHWPWLQHATVGLVAQPGVGDEWPRCKLHDYLGCGLPVVVEYDRGPPNAGDILTLQAGEVVPHGNIDAIIAAIWAIWRRKPDHEVIRRKAQYFSSWANSARLIESHLQDRLAQVRA